MADRVILHIGGPKSGTTFLQTLLWHHKATLKTAGLLVPGSQMFDHNRASMALRRGELARPGTGPKSPSTVWRRLKAEVDAWPGAAVLSNEWMTLAEPEHVETAVRDLAPARVDVVFTARDLVALAPAAWQESLKIGRSRGLDDFLAMLQTERDERWRWSTLDAAEVLPRWSSLPPERIHVVTVPTSSAGREVLWQRFAQVLGLDPDLYDVQVTAANESLSAEAAALLLRVGPHLRRVLERDGFAWNEPYRWIREYVAHDLLVPHMGSRIGLRQTDVQALRARGRDSQARIHAAGYSVIGDLDDLTGETPAGRHPDDVGADELLDLAVPLVIDLFTRLRREVRAARVSTRTCSDATGEYMLMTEGDS